MRVTFEKEDIVRMLSNVLGYELEDEDVTIKTDPFEVHIRKLNVGVVAAQKNSVVEGESSKPEGNFVVPSGSKKNLTLAEILAKNEKLGGPKAEQVHDDDEDMVLARPLGPTEFLEPPEMSEEELNALKR